MFGPIVYHEGSGMANAVARQMHNLVTYGPWDLDAASAMSRYGYDEAKWAEGQGVLAELVSSERPGRATLAAALPFLSGSRLGLPWGWLGLSVVGTLLAATVAGVVAVWSIAIPRRPVEE